MPSVLVKHNETILDVAVLQSGSIEGMFALALMNNISLTKDLVSGEIIETGDIIEPEIVEELKIRNARPACAIDIKEDEKLEGIGYWYINLDFIVS